MSNSKSSVSWRLNGLLRARQKAKAFAATSWENPGDSNQSLPFTKWQPQLLGGTGEDIDSQILDGQASSTENDLSGDGNPQQPTAEELLAEQQRQQVVVQLVGGAAAKGHPPKHEPPRIVEHLVPGNPGEGHDHPGLDLRRGGGGR